MKVFALMQLCGPMDTHFLYNYLFFIFISEETNTHYYILRANKR